MKNRNPIYETICQISPEARRFNTEMTENCHKYGDIDRVIMGLTIENLIHNRPTPVSISSNTIKEIEDSPETFQNLKKQRNI